MTVTEWTATMVIDAAVLLVVLIVRTVWRAFQSELDADTLRRIQADTAHCDFFHGGSAAQGVETPPAPGCPSPLHPGAGTRFQAGDSRLDLAGALDPGAGPEPRTVALSALPSRGEAAPPDGSDGPGPQTPVGAADPRNVAPTGPKPHPRGEGVGAVSPRLAAPTRGAA